MSGGGMPDFLTALMGQPSSGLPAMAPRDATALPAPTGVLPQPSSQRTIAQTAPTSMGFVESRKRYLDDQQKRILSRGGSEADVVTFLKREGLQIPNVSVTSSGPAHVPGYIAGIGMSALDGATFGFGDEAVGGLYGLATGIGVDAGIDEYRQSMRAFQDANPKVAGLAAFGGGLASVLLAPELGLGTKLLGAGAKASTMARVGLATAEGAGFGALAGAGSTDGGLSERARGALIGGVAGAALAGAGTGVVKALAHGPVPSATLGAAIGGLSGGGILGMAAGGGAGYLAGAGGQRVAQAVGSALERAGGRGAPGISVQAAQAGGAAARRAQPIWARLVSAVDPTEGSLPAQARRSLAEAFGADGITLDAAIQHADQLHASGVPATVADVGGDNVLAFLRDGTTARSPGAQEMVDHLVTRQGAQGERLLGSLFRELRVGVQNAYDAADALLATRKATSTPLYDAAYQKVVPVTAEVKQAFNSPMFRRAYEEGRLLSVTEDAAGLKRGLPVPPLQVVQEGPGGLRYVLDVNGMAQQAPLGLNVGDVANTQLPIRGLDYMKRGLDQIKKQTGTLATGPADRPVLDRQLGTAVGKQLQDLLDHVGTLDQTFGQARAAYKGPSDLLDALALGKGGPSVMPGKRAAGLPFTRKDPSVVAREINALNTDDQKAMYRLGALQDLDRQIARYRTQAPNVADAVFGAGRASSNAENRIRALFPDPQGAEASQFFDAVRGESAITAKSGELAKPREAPKSTSFRDLLGEAMGLHLGFRAAPVGVAIKQLTAHGREQRAIQLSNEVSQLGLRGLNGAAELTTLLDGLRSVALPHSAIVPAVVGNEIGRRAH